MIGRLLPEHEAEGLWLAANYLANDWLSTTWTQVNRLLFCYSTTYLHIGGREILGLVWTFLLALFTSTRLPSTSHPFSSWMKAGYYYQDPVLRIRCLIDPWIRGPRSGIGFFRIPDLGSRIPNPYIWEHIEILWKLAKKIFFSISKKT